MDPAADLLRQLPALGAAALDPRAATARPNPAADGVVTAAENFEAVFLAQMLAPMFETLETDGPFGGGSAEKIYRTFMVQEYGKVVARAGGVGIADRVASELLKLQEMNR